MCQVKKEFLFGVSTALIIIVLLIFVLLWPRGINPGNVTRISEMTDYLNQKYGYDVKTTDCIYYRHEDYSYHDGFLYGTTYDVPNIGIFDYDGRYITVTDRKGFFGDDNQLEDVNALVCGFFEETLGINPEYVEIREGITYNEILFYHYNKVLTEDNIDEFMQCIWEQRDRFNEFVFYFKAEEDMQSQVRHITANLGKLRHRQCIRSVDFYITDMEEPEILYQEARVHNQDDGSNSREPDIGYLYRNYQVVNPVVNHYSCFTEQAESIAKENLYNNTFLVGGSAAFLRGSYRGYGDREIQKINSFQVVDLTAEPFHQQIEQMTCYGTFRGQTVYAMAGAENVPSNITIKNGDKYLWEFKWEQSPLKLYAYSHGRMLELEDVYNMGGLSPEDMDSILEKHMEHYNAQFGSGS